MNADLKRMAMLLGILLGFVGVGSGMLFGIAAAFKVSTAQMIQFVPVVIGLPGGLMAIVRATSKVPAHE